MSVEPYLFFEGRCEEAIAFYRAAIGAEPGMLMRWKDAPPPGEEVAEGCAVDTTQLPPEKVMHASFRVAGSTLMASDGMCSGTPSFAGISLSLSADDDATARRWFDALADGGRVDMPMGATFFASSYGMLTDRFGLQWMVMKPLPMPA